MAWLAIRVRGSIHAKHDLVQTLEELRLNRPNHATIVPEDPSYRGMLDKVQGYITWGQVSNETVQLLIKERGHSPDEKPLDPKEIDTLASKVMESGLSRVDDLKPLFRLKAPKGGWRSTKKPFTMGGALGFREKGKKDDIDQLVKRMV